MLSVCILIYLNSVLRYKFLILYTYHLDTLDLSEQEYEDPCLFCEAKRVPPAKCFGNIGVGQYFSTFVRPRPGKFLFIRRGPRPNKFTRKYLSNFFKFIH